jgi:phenylacetate-CoA ligase
MRDSGRPSEKVTAAVLDRFRAAARRMPAYRALLREHAVDPRTIKDLAAFSRDAPLTDKASWFTRPLADLCVGGRLDRAAAIYTSSGFSGVFSFGAESAAQAAQLRRRVDALLDFYFEAKSRRTLLINALPPGVDVPSAVATVVETGGRADVVIAAMLRIAPAYEQVVLLGEHPLLKTILERGAAAGVRWPRHRVNIVTGAEVIPENFRAYAGRLLGHSNSGPGGSFLISFGVSEVSLSLGQETAWTRQLRQLAHRDVKVRTALFGDTPFTPTLVQFDPAAHYMESPLIDGRPRLVVTTLDHPRFVPLIRYATGDWAEVFSGAELRRRLALAGQRTYPGPRLSWPVLAVWGRGGCVRHGGAAVYPEQVKEAIYSEPHVAAALTGNFRLAQRRSGRATAHFQLQQGVLLSRALAHDLQAAIARWVHPALPVTLKTFHAFDALYPHADFQKFHYL